MEQRRLLVFLVLSMGLMIPFMLMRPLEPEPEPEQKQAPPEPAAAVEPSTGKNTTTKTSTDEPGTKISPSVETETKSAQDFQLPEAPYRVITLGSSDPKSGYALEVQLVSTGGSLLRVRTNDPRYRALPDPNLLEDHPLSLVGDHLVGRDGNEDGEIDSKELGAWPDSRGEETDPLPKLAFQISVASLNREFQRIGKSPRADLNHLNWKLVGEKPILDADGVPREVTFSVRLGDIELTKRYRLARLSDEDLLALTEATETAETIVDRSPLPYQLTFDLTLKNHGKQPASLTYDLQGPVGVPLEDLENSRYFSSIKWAKHSDTGPPEAVDAMTSEAIVEAIDDGEEPEPQTSTWSYVGVDVQYFAALLFPSPKQLKLVHKEGPVGYIAETRPELVTRGPEPQYSQVSMVLTSHPVQLEPGASATHSYMLFTGPKRPSLLKTMEAREVMDLTNFLWIGDIARLMLTVLGFIHMAVPWAGYGFAIVLLTICVRLAMHPLTRKQAAGAKKMKELQPEIADLKKKYADDKQALSRAQMELFRKNNYNPMSGCLPIVIQMPIFFGLYQSLRNSVDLRRASFLWIDNLAAPDALFHHGYNIPFLGQYFNLLPLLTVSLYLVNNKMFMPPATTPEGEMQQKMMNVMMVVFGFLFYRMPAGLLMYFIVSTLWGMGERKLLDLRKSDPAAEAAAEQKPKRRGPLGWLSEQLEKGAALAEQEKSRREQAMSSSKPGNRQKKKKNRRRR